MRISKVLEITKGKQEWTAKKNLPEKEVEVEEGLYDALINMNKYSLYTMCTEIGDLFLVLWVTTKAKWKKQRRSECKAVYSYSKSKTNTIFQ